MRRRGFESLPVLSIFDNLASNQAFMARAVAHLLAMQEVRVQLPLNALRFRTWKSLVFRVLWEHEIAASGTDRPTGRIGRDRPDWCESDRQ